VIRGADRAAIILAAVAAAVVPTPAGWVEGWYATTFYISVQQRLTAITNRLPLALFDVALALAACALLIRVVRAFRTRGERVRALARAGLDLAAAASVIYLLFLLLWGLNYRRAPITTRVDFSRDRVTPEAVERLAIEAADRLNELHPQAHARPWPGLSDLPAVMGRSFAGTQRALGLEAIAVPGRPKPTILSWYFRRAAIDGMTDPFFLEVLVNGDVLPFERPAIVAHEWAHLAGFAHEAEAGFVGWLTTTRGDAQAQYSGWLTLYAYLFGSLDDDARERVARRLGPGPREDLRAIGRRVRAAAAPVRAIARATYDRFLRANRVASGVGSYDEVVVLVVGSRAPEP
jgi:hypothetical protein